MTYECGSKFLLAGFNILPQNAKFSKNSQDLSSISSRAPEVPTYIRMIHALAHVQCLLPQAPGTVLSSATPMRSLTLLLHSQFLLWSNLSPPLHPRNTRPLKNMQSSLWIRWVSSRQWNMLVILLLSRNERYHYTLQEPLPTWRASVWRWILLPYLCVPLLRTSHTHKRMPFSLLKYQLSNLGRQDLWDILCLSWSGKKPVQYRNLYKGFLAYWRWIKADQISKWINF